MSVRVYDSEMDGKGLTGPTVWAVRYEFTFDVIGDEDEDFTAAVNTLLSTHSHVHSIYPGTDEGFDKALAKAEELLKSDSWACTIHGPGTTVVSVYLTQEPDWPGYWATKVYWPLVFGHMPPWARGFLNDEGGEERKQAWLKSVQHPAGADEEGSN